MQTIELLPATRHQRRITLTPLVDVIFLLLIFFMLTSQISPFSLINLSAKGAGKGLGNSAISQTSPAQEKPAPARIKVLITVLRGGIAINGQRVLAADIGDALQELRQSGIKTAIISPRSTSRMQDLIVVLEAIRKAGFLAVSIRKAGR